MTEWPYVMFVETLVFLLVGVGVVVLQNTLTGVAFVSLPPLATAALGTLALAWVLGVAGLVLLVATESGVTDGLSCALLRGGRAACGVVLLHVAAVGALCGVHSDPDMCVGMASGNHLFAPDSAFLYYVFAIALALSVSTVGMTLLVAQHGALQAAAARSALVSIPRMSWNLNLVLIALYETQFTMEHNAATSFAPRQVYAAWPTLIGLPALFVLDIANAKLVAIRALWATVVASVVLVLVVGGHASLIVLFPVLRYTDTLPVNVAVAALQVLCTVFDIASIASRQRVDVGSRPATSVVTEVPREPQTVTREGLFEMPVRAGVSQSMRQTARTGPPRQLLVDARIQRRPPLDLRAKKNV